MQIEQEIWYRLNGVDLYIEKGQFLSQTAIKEFTLSIMNTKTRIHTP
jgi:hypothetical protein